MISRRSFLIGAGSTVTLSLIDKFNWHLENKGVPFIDAPPKPKSILYVYPDREFQIGLDGDPWVQPPTPTWAEFLVNSLGERRPSTLSDFRNLYDEHNVLPSQLNEPCNEEYWFDHWCRAESPNAIAYQLIKELGIGSEMEAGDVVGGLQFHDGPNPGNGYLAVHAADEISVSLLQHRLNELGQSIAVELAECNIL